jgi:hypothetical protein
MLLNFLNIPPKVDVEKQQKNLKINTISSLLEEFLCIMLSLVLSLCTSSLCVIIIRKMVVNADC